MESMQDTSQSSNTQHRTSSVRSARTVALCILSSRILGLVRDIVCANIFGTGLIWSVFVTAWTVPNMFRRLFGEGALAAAFVPVFTDTLHKQGRKDAWKLFRVVATALVVTLAGILVAAEVGLLVLGRFHLSERASMTITLLAALFPYMLLICLAAFLMATLNALKRFLIPGLMYPVLNVFWLLGLLVMVGLFGLQGDARIWAVVVGILIGGVCQVAIHLPALRREGASFKPTLDLAHPGLKKVTTLFVPTILGAAAVQINVVVDKYLALGMIDYDGAVSFLYYGNRLMQFPLAMIGIAIATVALVAVAEHHALGRLDELRREIGRSLRVALFLGIPASVGLVLIRTPLIKLIFERGAFTAESTASSAAVLLWYGLGVWAFVLMTVVVRCFQATKDVRTPVKVAIGMVVLNLTLNLALIGPMKECGLALATTLTGITQLAILLVLLGRRVGRFIDGAFGLCVLRSAAGAIVMGGVVWTTLHFVPRYVDAGRTAGLIVLVGSALAAGLVSFVATAHLLGADELKQVLAFSRKRR